MKVLYQQDKSGILTFHLVNLKISFCLMLVNILNEGLVLEIKHEIEVVF